MNFDNDPSTIFHVAPSTLQKGVGHSGAKRILPLEIWLGWRDQLRTPQLAEFTLVIFPDQHHNNACPGPRASGKIRAKTLDEEMTQFVET